VYLKNKKQCNLTFKWQFNRFEPVNDTITERDFCELLLSYASLGEQEKKVYMKRVRKAFDPKESVSYNYTHTYI